jgi:uncharacterized protein YfkK (UPF0435 family)
MTDATPLNLSAPKTNPFGDQYFEEVNQNAFNSIGAKALIEKTFHEAFEQEKTLYFIVGSDSGQLLPFLEKQVKQDPSKKFVVFEAPEVISYLKLENRLPTSIDVRSMDTAFESLEEDYPHYITHNRMQLVRSLAVLDKKSPYYKEAWENKLTEFRSFQQSRMSLRTNNVFINAQIYNCVDNLYPVALFEKKFNQTSAVLLGGGPTLDDGIEWLKAHRNELLVFAAGRISARLLKEGIVPDFLVTVDPNDVSYDNTKQMEAFGDQSILIHTNYAHHSLLAEWRGPHCFTDRLFPWAEADQPDNLITSGPTVTNTMASISAFMGSPNIYLLGVDFCYGAQGETHESSSLENQLGEMFVHDVGQKVRTNSGRMAETNDTFANAMKAMNQLAEVAKTQHGIQFFNLGLESAAMENVPYVPLDEVKLGQANKQSEALAECREILDFSPAPVQKHYNKMKKQVQAFRKEVKETQKLGKIGLDAAMQLFDNEQQTDNLTQKITQTRGKLFKKHLPTLEFIYHYAIDAYAKFMDPSVSEDEMEQEEIKDNLINFFTAIVETSDDILLNVDKGLKHINQRKNEAKGESKIESLINFWKQNNEEGRVLVWLKQYDLDPTNFTPEHQQMVNDLIAQFKEKIAQTGGSKLEQKLKQSADSLQTVYTLTHEYFDEKNIDELQKIADFLKEKESFKAKELYKLAEGYLAELRGDIPQAYTYYTQIEDKKLLQIALKRIVQLTLDEGDYNSALNALEVLTEFSDDYRIPFADLAASMGRYDEALNAYSQYLGKHTEDAAAWLKLAKLLMQMGVMGEAENALNKVLELDAENQAATALKQEIEKQKT